MVGRLTRHSHGCACVIFLLALCLTGTRTPFVVAQSSSPPITSSGLGTQVIGPARLPGGHINYNITGGTRPGGGPNLFYSFGRFNVPTNSLANFLNESGLATSNILGRITGGNPSNIFGTIQTTGFGNANLFLVNPAGFLFGPTAALNVGGMVTFTSADYVKLSDGGLFHAIPDAAADGLLSMAPVAAFGFLGANPGAISVQGSQLSVQSGQDIALVGGNITIQSGTLSDGTVQAAQLSAPGGHIHLASVASPWEIVAGTLDSAANVNGQSFGPRGTIQISQQSVIAASGDGGGAVIIRGGRFLLDDSRISANTTGPVVGALAGQPEVGIDIQASQDVVIQNGALLETNVSQNVTPGIGSGGVRIKADDIQILGPQDLDNPSPSFTGIRSNVAPGSTGGPSGDITLQANSLLIKDFGTVTTTIESQTGGAGSGGNIALTTAQHLRVEGEANIQSFSDSGDPDIAPAAGHAGDLTLTSTQGDILLSNGPFVTSQTIYSGGKTGNIAMNALEGSIVLSSSEDAFPVTVFTHIDGTGADGGSGQIELNAKNLSLNNSGIQIDNFTPLDPGTIMVKLSGSLSLSGTGFPSRIATTTRGPASSSDLNIRAHDVVLADGSSLSSETFSSGAAGQLHVFAQQVQLTNGSHLRSSSTINPRRPPGVQSEIPTGSGGGINIGGLGGAAASVLIDGPDSGIFTNAEGTGAGGNTNIAAQSVTIENGGTISAATAGTDPSATGGSIAISAGQSVTLNKGASITATSTGPANAGKIVVNAGRSFTSTNSSITTDAMQASGGNITVMASDLIHLRNSQINASVQGAETTLGGNILVDPQFVILNNSRILAQANQGQGGNISIIANVFMSDFNSLVSASSQSGLSGTVTVQSPIAQAGGKIVPLSKTTLEVMPLLSQRCAALASGQYSSFVVAGPGTLPIEPGGWLATPLMAGIITEGRLPIGNRFGTLSGVTMSSEDGAPVSLRRLPAFGTGTILLSADWVPGCGS